MNHLAHFLLASHYQPIPLADSLSGAFLGDHIKGRLQSRFPEAIEQGIALHRRIDAYTDRHARVKTACQRFEDPFRRFAPIMVDLVFDYHLANHWQTYHGESLVAFNDKIFSLMASRLHLFPDKPRAHLLAMKDRRVLLSYDQPEFLQRSLIYLSTRIKRENPLQAAFPVLQKALPELESDFHAFFPELLQMIRQ